MRPNLTLPGCRELEAIQAMDWSRAVKEGKRNSKKAQLAKRGSLPPRQPGEVLKTLSWMAPRIYAMARREPGMACLLLGLDLPQIHLLGFALAHDPDGRAPHLVTAAVGASARSVLRSFRQEAAKGLARVLRLLPDEPMSQEDYRLLASVLSDPVSASILHHWRRSVDSSLLHALGALPAELRTCPVLAALDGMQKGPRLLMEWIGLVAGRRGDPSDHRVRELVANAASKAGLRACITTLVDDLPLPDGLPPEMVGKYRRIDSPKELHRLGMKYRNCLRHRIDDVNAARSLFYAWDAADPGVICEVVRANRYGWLLGDCLGPKNEDPEPDVLEQIRASFREAGISSTNVSDFADIMVSNLSEDAENEESSDDDESDEDWPDDMDSILGAGAVAEHEEPIAETLAGDRRPRLRRQGRRRR